MKYKCKICGYIYDEQIESKKWEDLPETWVCPICGVGKNLFEKEEEKEVLESDKASVKKDEKTVSKYIAEYLVDNGVRCAFGMVGHSILGMSEALREYVEKGDMRYVGIRHEGAAAFACSAYGKLMKKPALAITIAGPGATNLITGLYDAKLDSSPVIALTGQVESKALGFYIFQEIDFFNLFRDVSIFQSLVFGDSDFKKIAKKSLELSILKKGVSQIILPNDVQFLKVLNYKSDAKNIDFKTLEKKIVHSQKDIQSACEIINNSQNPLIVMGEGAIDAASQIKNFAKKIKCPIVTTYRAKGAVSDKFEYSCGLVGLSGTEVASKMLSECDCIISFGVGFSKHTALPKNKTIIQVDNDISAFGKRAEVSHFILGDSGLVLDALLKSDFKDFNDKKEEIANAWSSWNETKSARANDEEIGYLNSASALDIISNYVEKNAIVSVDVGELAYSFGKYFKSENQRILLSFYLGSIGVGLPSAIGAWCAANEKGSEHFGKKVYAFVGDGGFGQYLAEWTTVVKYNMDIVCIVLNNSELAKITKEQKNAHVEIWQTDLKNPSFAEYAKLCKSKSARVTNKAELEDALKNIPRGEPYLIEIISRH